MPNSALRGLVRVVTELVILLPGSMLVGALIGTLQHYVAFGVRGAGFGIEALRFAGFEGGTVGWMFGVPTGLLVYYAALRRRVDVRLVMQVLAGSLVIGCVLGLLFGIPSAVLTPLFTIGLALMLNQNREQKDSESVR
jgi:hypothetical protein